MYIQVPSQLSTFCVSIFYIIYMYYNKFLPLLSVVVAIVIPLSTQNIAELLYYNAALWDDDS